MSNVIEFSGSPEGQRNGTHCWLCQNGVSIRALFCHSCGTIQPVKDLDHFARLGLEMRIDLDVAQLEKQYATLRKTLDPARFAVRGIGERGHAAKQLEALEQAYETLRDPLRRGRYWLSLHEKESANAGSSDPMIDALREELVGASEASHCDRIAQKAGQAMEQGIKNLMQALRVQNWLQANSLLVALDGLEGIMRAVHDRRDQVAVPSSSLRDDVTRLR